MKYIGLAFSLSMLSQFPVNLNVQEITPEEVKSFLQEAESCCNPSHQATLIALKEKYGLEISVPPTPPRVLLKVTDEIVVLQVSGLPRLTDRHEYNSEEIEKAKFTFLKVTVPMY